MDKKEFALMQHEKWNGKIEVIRFAERIFYCIYWHIWINA